MGCDNVPLLYRARNARIPKPVLQHSHLPFCLHSLASMYVSRNVATVWTVARIH